jgi:peptidoglycan/xylan/chitin deacetylase (PgdA/CDA1 family)
MYLPTSFIGDSPLQFSGLECLTWKRVRELMQEGFAFGSHSVTHKRLYSLDAAGLDYELRVSKEMIEQNTSTPVDSFAYPSAFPEADPRFVQRFKDLLVKNGYQYAVNTIIGTAMRGSDPLLVRRLPVNSWDDEPLFRAKLNGAYDWLRTLQYAGKRLRRGLSHAA